jgi:WD40 repeat protein
MNFFPDNRHIATITFNHSRICVWDILTGEQLSTSPIHKEIRCVALSPVGDQFAIGYYDCTIGLWNVTSDGEHGMPSHRYWQYQLIDGIVTLAFSPDGYRIRNWTTVYIFGIAIRECKSANHCEGMTRPSNAWHFVCTGHSSLQA